MSLPELSRERLEQQLQAYCARKVPIHARDLVRLAHAIDGTTVTLTEWRAPVDGGQDWRHRPIAQCRFDPQANLWSLFCHDRAHIWHRYRHAEPVRDIGALLHAIDIDPTGIFWG